MALATASAAWWPGPARAGKAPNVPDEIAAAVRAAVAQRRLSQSRLLGWGDDRHAFTELPSPGTLLIGFDVGVGRFANIETVYALRAIYRIEEGEGCVQDRGLFANLTAGGGRHRRSQVVRTVSLRARPGYAVGGMFLRTGLNINGLAVTFMRIKGRVLDPTDAYTSTWVGDRTGGGEAYVGGDGQPVVGVFGTADEVHVSALGLIFANVPAPPPPVEEPLPSQPPKAAPPPGRKPSAQPTPSAAAPPAAVPTPPGAEPAAVTPATRARFRATGGEASASATTIGPLPFIVGGAVALLLILVALVAGRKGKVRQPDDGVLCTTDEPAPAPAHTAAPHGQGALERFFARLGAPAVSGSNRPPLANRIASTVTVVVTATFITCVAPRLWPGPGFSVERMMASGVVGGLAGGLGWVIGKCVEAFRRS